MIKVVLLGDSIRQVGYGTVIEKYLPSDKYEIWQPVENCRFIKNTLRMLVDYKDKLQGADVIHWNNGLWDMAYPFKDNKPFTSLEEYKENILRAADILLSYSKKVIFATTTPVKDKHPDNENITCEKYNKEIVPLLKEKGIIINDLYSFVKDDLDEMISDVDYIHLTEIGKNKVAQEVANLIKKVAAE